MNNVAYIWQPKFISPFDDDEVYELMQKYKNNDEAVINELNERGETHEWEDIGKGN